MLNIIWKTQFILLDWKKSFKFLNFDFGILDFAETKCGNQNKIK
jgi:hypothetical protein